ncbi:hypothetical protein D3C76_1857080 [compost metagenome]
MRAQPTARVRRFSFRGVRPLICPERLSIGGQILSEGKATVWVGNEAGIAQLGEVEFD